MKKRTKVFYLNNPEYLNDATMFVHASLEEMGIEKKQVLKSELLFEETLVRFVQYAKDAKQFEIVAKRFLGEVSVTLMMQGEEFDIYADEDQELTGEDEYSAGAIRAILLKAYGDSFQYNNKHGSNKVRLSVDRTRKALYATLLAMLLGVAVGLIAQFLLPEGVQTGLKDYLLSPVKSMFMSALKIIIAPVVFFSIVTCFSQYENISQFGKLGVKVLCIYIFTTVIAVFLAMGLSTVFQPGELGFALAGNLETSTVEIDTNIDTSILSTIIGIVPSNFIKPFLEANTLQLIFLAVLCGISLGIMGETSSSLKELFDNLNSLFLTITRLIAKLIPIAVFCSLAIMVMELKLDAFVSLLGATVLQISALLSMIVVYGILIILLARLNPIKFYKKIREGMITSFTLSSSSAFARNVNDGGIHGG